MGFLNDNLSFYSSQIQSNQVNLTPGSLQVSHQEQVGKVLTLLSSESEARAQAYFAANAGSTPTTDTLAANRKAILDALSSVNTQLSGLAKGLSSSDELQFILSYSQTVATKVAQARQEATSSAHKGAARTSSTTSGSKSAAP
jgi:hypothetical protein